MAVQIKKIPKEQYTVVDVQGEVRNNQDCEAVIMNLRDAGSMNPRAVLDFTHAEFLCSTMFSYLFSFINEIKDSEKSVVLVIPESNPNFYLVKSLNLNNLMDICPDLDSIV